MSFEGIWISYLNLKQVWKQPRYLLIRCYCILETLKRTTNQSILNIYKSKSNQTDDMEECEDLPLSSSIAEGQYVYMLPPGHSQLKSCDSTPDLYISVTTQTLFKNKSISTQTLKKGNFLKKLQLQLQLQLQFQICGTSAISICIR